MSEQGFLDIFVPLSDGEIPVVRLQVRAPSGPSWVNLTPEQAYHAGLKLLEAAVYLVSDARIATPGGSQIPAYRSQGRPDASDPGYSVRIVPGQPLPRLPAAAPAAPPESLLPRSRKRSRPAAKRPG